jgi:DNA invertase Pin-like site-specific DNA recombinase
LLSRLEQDERLAPIVDRLNQELRGFFRTTPTLHLRVNATYTSQGIDTTTPAGKAMFQKVGVFAKFERAMIRERVASGLARARAERKVLGRPRVSKELEERARVELAKGAGIMKVA